MKQENIGETNNNENSNNENFMSDINNFSEKNSNGTTKEVINMEFNNKKLDEIVNNLKEETLLNNQNAVENLHSTNLQLDSNNDNSNSGLFGQFEIKENNKNNDMNYELLFSSVQTNSSNKINKKINFTSEDLKNDNSMLKRALIAHKDEYISIQDWDFRIEEIEEKFKAIEKKINRGDLYNLYNTVKKCDLYSESKNFRDKPPSVGPVSTLEYMVESTFGFDKYLQSQMSDHIISLEKHIFRWRSILGDGNCYYRAIIFAFLERIIFDKNILLLKSIMIEINEKFDENYPNTRNLKISTRQEITNLNKSLILKIIYLIFEILDQNNAESVQNAYEVLIKSFVFARTFDIGMIIYFKYKLYEFTKENKKKVYTKEFPVKIGNLLPSEYETKYGDFLYDKFFEEQLMKLDIDAEKIVIYLTPFVLKLNVKIIIYEFDTDSTVLDKEFPCYVQSNYTISLLYRKTHYDLVYEVDSFERNSKELCYYVNLNENLRVVNSNILDSKRKTYGTNIYTSNNLGVNNKKIQLDGNNSNKSNSYKEIININEENLNINCNNQGDINNINAFFPQCVSCNQQYVDKSNFLNLCINCLKLELGDQFMANYLAFINECIVYYQEGKEQNIPIFYNEIFMNRKIIFRDNPVTLNKLANLEERNIKELILEMKSKVCLVCSKNIENGMIQKQGGLILPCNCNLCSSKCFNFFFKLVFKKKKNSSGGNSGNTMCICMYHFNNNDYKIIYEYLEKNNLKDFQKIIQSFVIANLSTVCIGGCMEDIKISEREFHLLVLKDRELTKLYKIKEFKHIICDYCFGLRKIKEKDNIECIHCNSTHKVHKIKKNISHKDDDCIIL